MKTKSNLKKGYLQNYHNTGDDKLIPKYQGKELVINVLKSTIEGGPH